MSYINNDGIHIMRHVPGALDMKPAFSRNIHRGGCVRNNSPVSPGRSYVSRYIGQFNSGQHPNILPDASMYLYIINTSLTSGVYFARTYPHIVEALASTYTGVVRLRFVSPTRRGYIPTQN